MIKKRIILSCIALGCVFILGAGIMSYVNRNAASAMKDDMVSQNLTTQKEEKSDSGSFEIKVPSAYYVAVGSVSCDKEDLLKSVSAYNEKGEVETELSIELPWFQTEKEGQYLATITATDVYGAVVTEKIPVYVFEREAMTAHILETMETDETFTYEIFCDDTGNQIESLSENDIETVCEKTAASAVNFYFDLENGGHGYGNGFVIDLTDDAVYIASNYHVIYAFDKKAEICFSDGTKITGYDVLGGDENADVAFIKIDRNLLSEECFKKLAEPAISLVRVKNVKEGEALVRSSLSKEGTMQYEKGTFLEYDYELYNGNRYTTFTASMSEGNSGSPIYDGYGNLISMCAGVGTEDGLEIMCGVRLEDIIALFEQYTGLKLYAY